MKYVNDFKKHFISYPVFTFKDVEKFLIFKGGSEKYAKRFLQNMIEKKTVNKITKGFYSLHDETEIIGLPFKPFYYGLNYALSHHNVWHERANPVIITTRRVKPGVRNILGVNVNIKHISQQMFFGYDLVKGDNFYYPVSNLEKTLIDYIYFKMNPGEEALKNLLHSINNSKLEKYLKKCNARTKMQVDKLLDKYPNGIKPS